MEFGDNLACIDQGWYASVDRRDRDGLRFREQVWPMVIRRALVLADGIRWRFCASAFSARPLSAVQPRSGQFDEQIFACRFRTPPVFAAGSAFDERDPAFRSFDPCGDALLFELAQQERIAVDAAGTLL